MSETSILAAKPGTVTDADKAALREAGIIVVETDAPEDVKFLSPAFPVSSNAMALAAVWAIFGSYDSETRKVFLKGLIEAMEDQQ